MSSLHVWHVYTYLLHITYYFFYVLPVDQSTPNPVQMLPDGLVVKTMLSGEVAVFFGKS
jgi:hypothetical protein